MSFSSPPPIRFMSPPPVYDSTLPVSNSGLTPYLQLPHILSLTWLAYPILSLVFVAFRLQLSSDSAQTAINNAKADHLTGCLAAQQAATSAASLPRFMAVATNEQIVDAVNASMNGAREALVLSLTIMEAIMNFIVDTYRSTFLCFLELIVGGGLSLIIGATQEINTFLTNTFNSLRTSIQNDVATVNSAVQTAINGINKVNPFGNIQAPQFSIPSLDALQNVTLPTDFQDALTSLNASLPSVSVLKHTVNDLLDTPFEAVKADINDTFASINFNSSVFPLPDRNTITFCDRLDTSIIDDLGHDLLKITKIGFILVVVVLLMLLAGISVLEWYKWCLLKIHLGFTRKAWMSDPTIVHVGPASAPTMALSDHNMLIFHADSTHPLLTRLANKISALLHLRPSQFINLSWFLHYVFHPPALACFLIGFFGILSVQLQLLAVAPLEAKYHDRSTASAKDLSGTIFTSLNQSMYNQSAFYANGINSHIDNIQSTVNDGLFGWVNATTTTLNDTVNTFYNDLQDAVTTLFNGTVLEQPALGFIRCFIGSKVDEIEAALTFLHDNLHIDIPRVNESVLVVSPDEVNAATQSIASAAAGTNDNPNGGLVGRLINTYVQSLKKERIMFAVFLGLWAVVVLMALAIIFWHSYGRQLLNSWGKRRFQRNKQTGSGRIVVPFQVEKLTEATDLPPKKSLTIRRIEPSDLEGQNSLSNLTPAAGKSFDSFFDHASQERGVRKLPSESGWRKHLTLALRRDIRAVRKSFHQVHRPKLTISTGRAAARSTNLPEIERISPSIPTTTLEDDRYTGMGYDPKSAWSLSPETASMPAISIPNPGPRRMASVPVSVGGDADSFALSPAAVAFTQFAVPLHFGIPHSASESARKSHLLPIPKVGRGRGENPFVTPFDDDARVSSSVPVTAQSMTADISFVPVSAVSRDSDFPAEMSFATGRAL
ncbi:hypothetical protein F5148DRAFT_251782 [Russula earlei]|uniref:Uncharacterized protein n=1 Tax=Russula earlei TaxID=71964 RepID=A0ACC0U382_9AGAM|nr:hypothetical protein F5148DRAFT_251782 [Russula earlei]